MNLIGVNKRLKMVGFYCVILGQVLHGKSEPGPKNNFELKP